MWDRSRWCVCTYSRWQTVLASTVSMSRHTCVTKHFVNETQSPSRPWRCAGEVWSHGDTASAPVGVSSLSGSEKKKKAESKTEFWHNCSHFECSSTDLIYTLIKLIYVVPLHSALASDVWWYNLCFKKPLSIVLEPISCSRGLPVDRPGVLCSS